MVCINLAGLLTFIIQRIHPIIPEKVKRAKRMTNIALVIWILSLLVFINMILLRRGVFDVIRL
jgi:hypothetical protein